MDCRRADVRESPVAKSVTSCPRRCSSSVSSHTSCSIEPVLVGPTRDAIGATWAIRSRLGTLSTAAEATPRRLQCVQQPGHERLRLARARLPGEMAQDAEYLAVGERRLERALVEGKRDVAGELGEVRGPKGGRVRPPAVDEPRQVPRAQADG